MFSVFSNVKHREINDAVWSHSCCNVQVSALISCWPNLQHWIKASHSISFILSIYKQWSRIHCLFSFFFSLYNPTIKSNKASYNCLIFKDGLACADKPTFCFQVINRYTWYVDESCNSLPQSLTPYSFIQMQIHLVTFSSCEQKKKVLNK